MISSLRHRHYVSIESLEEPSLGFDRLGHRVMSMAVNVVLQDWIKLLPYYPLNLPKSARMYVI